MDKEKNSRLIFTLKLVIPLIIIISLFIGGVSTGVITFELPNKTTNSNQINATIIIDFGDGKTYSKDMKIYNLTVFDFLVEVQKIGDITLESSYNEQIADFEIKSIAYNGKKYTHGENSYWWLFYINDQFSTDAADKIYIKNNDIIKWVYEKF